MLPWSAELSGRIDEQTITSQLLKDNPLRDRPTAYGRRTSQPPRIAAAVARRRPLAGPVTPAAGLSCMSWGSRTDG